MSCAPTTCAGSSTTAATTRPTPRWKVSQLAKAFDYPLTCIGVPKTIDNDLAVTDTCPGFGSAAKYTAVSVREAALDVAAMAETSTKVFVYEAMGRHAGWLAAAAGLAGQGPDDAPHIILLPERAYDEAAFLAKVKARGRARRLLRGGGLRRHPRRRRPFVADAGGGKDSFGHTQLGGVASQLAGRVKDTLGCKVHWTLPDYLQRSARHIASKTDWEQAQAVGKAAVQFALEGPERGDAGDRAQHRRALPLEDRGRAAAQDRQPREENAGRLHPQGWLRHHRRGPRYLHR